jgi:hypothetical protein
MTDNSRLGEEELEQLFEMARLKPNAFMRVALKLLKDNLEDNLANATSKESKLSAIDTMLKHFEGQEEYLDCAFLRDLRKRVEDEY